LKRLALRRTFLTVAALGVCAAASAQTLERFASLPADTFAPGPTSGQLILPPLPNGRIPPFVDKQPVQGFSSVLRTSKGDFLAMPDNGFGTKESSPDYILRVYRISPQNQARRHGDYRHQVVHHAPRPASQDQLSHPRRTRCLPWDHDSGRSANQAESLADGLGLRYRIGARGTRRNALVRRRIRTVPAPYGRHRASSRGAVPAAERHQWFYRLDDPLFAIGDLTTVEKDLFLVIERDNNQGTAAAFKKIFLVDFEQCDMAGF
jgi:Esterase-like activity of phytase